MESPCIAIGYCIGYFGATAKAFCRNTAFVKTSSPGFPLFEQGYTQPLFRCVYGRFVTSGAGSDDDDIAVQAQDVFDQHIVDAQRR